MLNINKNLTINKINKFDIKFDKFFNNFFDFVSQFRHKNFFFKNTFFTEKLDNKISNNSRLQKDTDNSTLAFVDNTLHGLAHLLHCLLRNGN